MRRTVDPEHPVRPAFAAAALATQGTAYLLYAMTERDRHWRAGAVAGSMLCLIVAVLSVLYARQRLTRWLVVLSLVLGVPLYLRIRLRAPRRKVGRR